MNYRILVIALLVSFSSFGQKVPEVIYFANLKLKLSDQVRKIIENDVNSLTRNPSYFQQKVDRADLYFPLVEKVFKEEGLPEDFKYLCLQESALVPDAVSSSNAVGYWQFKKESAVEVGLRVDEKVDERMHIVASSRGAAKYLKKNNFYLNNWVYALLSYNLGLGGVKSHVKDKYKGAAEMEIDKDMHWYVIRFLAHKIAFEPYVNRNAPPAVSLCEFGRCQRKTLEDVARETGVPYQEIVAHNKWLLKGPIPDDREYYIILPLKPGQEKVLVQNTDDKKDPVPQPDQKIQVVKQTPKQIKKHIPPDNPVEEKINGQIALIATINGLKVIKAREGDTPAKLALRGGITTKEFLEYNDMGSYEKIIPGDFYYLQAKKNHAIILFHTTGKNETIWEISQKYGIRMNSIRKKNGLGFKENPQPGMVLWLRKKRPKSTPVEIIKLLNEPEVKKIEQIIKPETKSDNNSGSVKKDETPVQEKNTDNNSATNGNNKSGEAKYHIVQQGEGLFSIARTYNTDVVTLKKLNGLDENGSIKVGQKLIVGYQQKAGKEPLKHVVAEGETLYKISKLYGVTPEDIKKWNNLTGNDIKLGQALVILK